MAGLEEGADAGGLSRRGPALPGLRCSSASEPAKMCLVTGPLSGELRSPPDWDPEPLLCRRAHPRPPWERTVALRAHPLSRLRALLSRAIRRSVRRIAGRQPSEKAQPPGWGREEVTKGRARSDAPTCGGRSSGPARSLE